MPTDDHLQHVLVHLRHHGRRLLGGREEDECEESDLELGAGADEGAADGLHQTFPAELQVEDVVILVGLEKGQKHRDVQWSDLGLFSSEDKGSNRLTVSLLSLAL